MSRAAASAEPTACHGGAEDSGNYRDMLSGSIAGIVVANHEPELEGLAAREGACALQETGRRPAPCFPQEELRCMLRFVCGGKGIAVTQRLGIAG